MVAFLTQEWLDRMVEALGSLPERAGATATLQVEVSGGPAGEVTYTQQFRDGRLVVCTVGPSDDAEVTLTQPYADALAIARGDLDVSAAFMQGRVKVVGPMGPVMAVQSILQSTDYRAAVSDLASLATS